MRPYNETIIAMNPTDNNTNSSFTPKRTKPRYINLFEDVFLTLTPDTLKLYLTLRFEADYATECSSVKKNIKFLMNKTGLARRQVFYSLKEMELVGLLMRESKKGEQSTYWVAQDLNHFKSHEVQDSTNQKEIDQKPVQDTHGVVQQSHGVVQDTHTIINNSFTNSSHKEPIVDFQSTENYKDDPLFMQFYSVYPLKEKPSIARKAFYKHKPDQDFVSMLVTDVKARVENNWKNRHKSKIPHPSTYLNGKEWEGAIIEPDSNVANFPNKPPRFDMQELTAGIL